MRAIFFFYTFFFYRSPIALVPFCALAKKKKMPHWVAVPFNFSEEKLVFRFSFKVLLFSFRGTGRVITITKIIIVSLSWTLHTPCNWEKKQQPLIVLELCFLSILSKVQAKKNVFNIDNFLQINKQKNKVQWLSQPLPSRLDPKTTANL